MLVVALGACAPHLQGGADATGEGFEVGQTVPDLHLADQNGDEVSFASFEGDLVLLDVSTLWCGPCQLLAAEAEATWQRYRDQGFVYLTVIQQGQYADPATPGDVAAWADQFGITAPVVGDPDALTTPALEVVGGVVAFPGVLVVGRDQTVIERVTPATTDEVDDAIRANL
jgi:peroxiredoxin